MTLDSKKIAASRNAPVIAVARSSIESRLNASTRGLAPASYRWKENDEHLHQLRVWSRRANAAIDLYRDFLPAKKADWMQKSLKQLRKSSNAARDDDVFLRRLKVEQSHHSLKALIKQVKRHRRESHESFSVVASSFEKKGKLQRRARELASSIRPPKHWCNGHSHSFKDFAPSAIEPVIQQWILCGCEDLARVKQLHRFRVSGKRLRYSLELLAPALKPKYAKAMIKKMSKLQQRIGELTDHDFAIGILSRWIDEADKRSLRFLKSSRKHERCQFENKHRDFLDWWDTQKRNQYFSICQRLVPKGITLVTK